jgi:hypothetical protein
MMIPAMNKRVWILGAGFSQPLGGPLLKDLFRLEPPSTWENAFPSEEFPGLSDTIYGLQTCFYWGRERAGYWEDAEEFLAYVDEAWSGGEGLKHKKTNLQELIRAAERPYFRTPASYLPLSDRHQALLSENLYLATVRALAAQCHGFLLGSHPDVDEKWLPFRSWATSLDPRFDVILTFNYDRVIRAIDPHKKFFQLLLPGEQESPTRVSVFRLHGGIDWKVGDDRVESVDDPLDLLRSKDARIAIAPPGRRKAHFVENHLEPLWRQAEYHLSRSDTVFFIGYGFPKSDPLALRRILGALKEVVSEKGLVARDFHIVLGPEDTSLARRVVALLQPCTAGRPLVMVPPAAPLSSVTSSHTALRIKQHPLWTQDFLADWQDRIKETVQLR